MIKLSNWRPFVSSECNFGHEIDHRTKANWTGIFCRPTTSNSRCDYFCLQIMKYSNSLPITHPEWSKWQISHKLWLFVETRCRLLIKSVPTYSGHRLEITGSIICSHSPVSGSYLCTLHSLRWHTSNSATTARLVSQTTTVLWFVCIDKTGAVGHVSLKYCRTVV